MPAAIGYAEQAGLPFELGIVRNHYVGRTFIEPTDSIRHFGVKLKHNANRAVLSGRRVVLVDDSIVRGTTSLKIVEMVARGRARPRSHMRIASPPTEHSCFYGVDTPDREQLLASRMDLAEMARHIGVDSLAFISIDGLYRAMGEAGRDPRRPQFCDACFTGDYPIPLSDRDGGDEPVQPVAARGGRLSKSAAGPARRPDRGGHRRVAGDRRPRSPNASPPRAPTSTRSPATRTRWPRSTPVSRRRAAPAPWRRST